MAEEQLSQTHHPAIQPSIHQRLLLLAFLFSQLRWLANMLVLLAEVCGEC